MEIPILFLAVIDPVVFVTVEIRKEGGPWKIGFSFVPAAMVCEELLKDPKRPGRRVFGKTDEVLGRIESVEYLVSPVRKLAGNSYKHRVVLGDKVDQEKDVHNTSECTRLCEMFPSHGRAKANGLREHLVPQGGEMSGGQAHARTDHTDIVFRDSVAGGQVFGKE